MSPVRPQRIIPSLQDQVGVGEARRKSSPRNRGKGIVLDVCHLEWQWIIVELLSHVAFLADDRAKSAIEPFKVGRLLIISLRLSIFHHLVALGIVNRKNDGMT